MTNWDKAATVKYTHLDLLDDLPLLRRSGIAPRRTQPTASSASLRVLSLTPDQCFHDLARLALRVVNGCQQALLVSWSPNTPTGISTTCAQCALTVVKLFLNTKEPSRRQDRCSLSLALTSFVLLLPSLCWAHFNYSISFSRSFALF